MKNVAAMSQNIKKILIIILLVMFLGACGENQDDEVKCTNEGANAANCIQVNDISCLGCNIFELLFNAASVNVMKLHKDLTTGSMSVMMVAFAIWLAIRLLKFVSSMADSSISQVWNDIIKQAFLCVFCGILASSPDMLIYAVNTFVYPIYAAMLKLGIAIMENAVNESNGTSTTFNVFGEQVSVATIDLKCTFDKAGLITKDGFPTEFREAIVCMLKAVRGYLTVGGEVAYTLKSEADNIRIWLAGTTLWLFFWVVRVGFVFYLVDTIFQMGIIILLLPIFILSYAFKTTRKWASIGFQNLLSSAGFLMCFSIIVVMVLRAMIELIVNNASIFNPSDSEAAVSNIGVGFLCLLLIGALIYGSMGVTQQITGALIGSKIDANFQKNLVKILNKVKGWTLNGLASLVTAGTSLLPASIQKQISMVKEAKAKIDRIAGRKKD